MVYPGVYRWCIVGRVYTHHGTTLGMVGEGIYPPWYHPGYGREAYIHLLPSQNSDNEARLIPILWEKQEETG